MPMTWPAASASGPPESPETMSALVSIIPCRVSLATEPPWSLAVMDWFSPVTWPAAGTMVLCPSALPMATTAAPVFTVDESPMGTVCRPDAPWSWISAMSPVSSYPTTLALYCLPVAVVAEIEVESSMTWLLVSTRPLELSTMPVAAAASLLYCSVVLISTRPGSTLPMMACSFAPLAGLLLLGCGIAALGCGAAILLDGCGAAVLLLAG